MSNTFSNIPEDAIIADSFATLPGSAQIGQIATVRDTQDIYVFDGSVWQLKSGGGGGGGVTTLNGLSGTVNIVAGSNITVTPGSGTITISSTGSGGIASINGDSTAAQTISTGTTGTDFNITDPGSGSHVLNLPTASATNRGALSSADWSTFNSKANSILPTANQVVYVNSNAGSDLTGDGSYPNPYATIAHAMTTITDANSNKPYVVAILANRQIETTDIFMKPYTFIVGFMQRASYIRINGGGALRPDPSHATVNSWVGLGNLYWGGNSPINWNLQALGGNNCEFFIENSTITGNPTFLGRNNLGGGGDYLESYNGIFTGNLTVDSFLCQQQGLEFVGTVTNTNTQGTSFLSSTYENCVFDAGISVSGPTNPINMYNCSYASGATFTSVGTITINSYKGLPVPANQTISGTTTLNNIDNASGVPYVPGVPTNWVSAPTQVSQALDALAVESKPAPYTEFHVLSSYTGVQTGSYNQPFSTIAAAITASISLGNANNTIFLHDSPTENVVINNYGANLQIQSFGVTSVDSQIIRLNGNITISGSSTRIRIQNIKIAYPGGTQPDLIDSSAGRNYFSNVDFGGGGGIQFTGSWARWHEFTDCTINGPISIAGTPAAGSTVSLWRVRGGGNYTLNAANASLMLYDNFSVGNVTQTAGNLTIDGGRGFVAGSTITSTTSSGSDLMEIINVSLQSSGSSFVQINKTGTCPYILSNVFRNESGDVLTGTRLVEGATSADASYLPTTPANWPVVPNNVKSALDELAAGSGSLPPKVDTFALSSTDITNKGVILSSIPSSPTKVVLIVGNAPGQIYSLDYVIDSNLSANKTLDWTGLGLDGVLSAGDNLIVQYF